ncbi:O-antigen ligase family protein [Rubrivirga sp. IMCC43871]|uniref:O-antigen ligase family protein n=1 Tax=Rubrivirga sp. IMCC43871 TaxID=3391575 RepID=UPI00398FC9AB
MEIPAWTYRPAVVGTRSFADRYVTFLGVVLLGYAMAGRGFAYVGAPPLFIGEVALALGLVALVSVRRQATLYPTGPMMLAAVLVVWAVVKVVIGVPQWGFDAARDGMLVLYALFAFVSYGLVTARPERLRTLVRRFSKVAWGLAFFAIPVLFINRMYPFVPPWPWAPVNIIQTKPGDLLVLLAAAVTYVAAGFVRPRAALVAGLTVGALALMVTSRGGMLGFVLAMSLAALWKPAMARFGRFAYVGVLLLVLGLSVGSMGIEMNNGDRDFSVGQIWENIKSIAGQSDDHMLRGTAEWRLEWWGDIVGYTFAGEHFLDGKGFGINLATDDGFAVDDAGSLRSPHNSHLTVLARGGVPLFLGWLALQGWWFISVAAAARRARRRKLDAWAAFYAVCGALWLGAHVNASFDVYLEGPMGAVWFWTVFGLALAGVRLQESHPHLLDDVRALGPSAPPEASAAPPSDATRPWSWAAPA